MVGQLRAGLGAGDAHAYRYAYLPCNGGAHVGRQIRLLLVMNTGEIQKTFVDAVHLLPRRKTFQNTHHPLAHVGIDGVVAGQGDDT